ncbi:MAG: 4-alpha-glucanotransferase, partial [Eubacterium sp.]|nr:4-alpha-glucanotransferase [Eubacterium sp.]
MLDKRGAGVLLHISSMPSPYGVGVFDKNAKEFIDSIADMGFTYWQVLPFNPLDGANSPYCSPSAFAGNYLFINPEGLRDMGLISDEDVSANFYADSPYTAEYEFAAKKRLATLKKAFLNINDELAKDIKAFELDNPWLTDYSVFMAVKEAEDMKPWWEWSSEHAHYF